MINGRFNFKYIFELPIKLKTRSVKVLFHETSNSNRKFLINMIKSG